jgi:hypothetical protein
VDDLRELLRLERHLAWRFWLMCRALLAVSLIHCTLMYI